MPPDCAAPRMYQAWARGESACRTRAGECRAHARSCRAHRWTRRPHLLHQCSRRVVLTGRRLGSALVERQAAIASTTAAMHNDAVGMMRCASGDPGGMTMTPASITASMAHGAAACATCSAMGGAIRRSACVRKRVRAHEVCAEEERPSVRAAAAWFSVAIYIKRGRCHRALHACMLRRACNVGWTI